MALETSISSEDTNMAKNNAINSIVEQGKVGLDKLKSGITSTMAKVGLVGILTFGATEAIGQSKDVAMGSVKSPMGQVDKKVVGEDPIKDSIEYKKKRAELLKELEEVQRKQKDIINNKILFDEQMEMLSGSIDFFNRIQEQQGGIVTERDGKYARAGIAIIDRREWLPELQMIASKSRKILVYISSQAPQPVITKN